MTTDNRSSAKSGPAGIEYPFADGVLHGYGILLHIQRASDDLLSIEEGYQPLRARSNWARPNNASNRRVKVVRALLRYARG